MKCKCLKFKYHGVIVITLSSDSSPHTDVRVVHRVQHWILRSTSSQVVEYEDQGEEGEGSLGHAGSHPRPRLPHPDLRIQLPGQRWSGGSNAGPDEQPEHPCGGRDLKRER